MIRVPWPVRGGVGSEAGDCPPSANGAKPAMADGDGPPGTEAELTAEATTGLFGIADGEASATGDPRVAATKASAESCREGESTADWWRVIRVPWPARGGVEWEGDSPPFAKDAKPATADGDGGPGWKLEDGDSEALGLCVPRESSGGSPDAETGR